MLEQPVRELGDGEDEHQIEEQFDVGDTAVFVSTAATEQVPPCRDHGAFNTFWQAAGSFGR